MIRFSPAANPLLDALDKAHALLKDSALNPETLSQLQPELHTIQTFFEAEPEATLFLALLVREQLDNKEPSVAGLISHLDLRISAATRMHQLLAPFVKKEWIRPQEDPRYYPNTIYRINKLLIQAVCNMSWKGFRKKDVRNSWDLISSFGKILQDRRDRLIPYDQFVEETYCLISLHEKIEVADFILQLDLEPSEAAEYLYLGYLFCKGTEMTDIDYLINDLRPGFEAEYHLRHKLKRGSGILFENGLVELQGAESPSREDMIRLTPYALKPIVQSSTAIDAYPNTGSMTLIKADAVEPKEMKYNPAEQHAVGRITRLLMPESLEAFRDRMKKLGMKPGISMLFHGEPGTGKTETALQIARLTGRDIFLAEIAQVRGKYVGETEKNIHQLFVDYKKACEKATELPILLFNEADAILSKRRAVRNGVDQMENNLQNILLQELENFKGIFIATTNLTANLDTAFDRRILYKIHFAKPCFAARYEMLKAKLPFADHAVLEMISNEFELSGGQIDNISKKLQVESLLDPEQPASAELIRVLAEQELSLQTPGRQPRPVIGFVRAA